MPRNGGNENNSDSTAPPAGVGGGGFYRAPPACNMLTQTYLEAPILTSATSRLFLEKKVLRASLSSSNSFSEFKFPTNKQNAAEEGNSKSQLDLRVEGGVQRVLTRLRTFILKVTSKISVLSPL